MNERKEREIVEKHEEAKLERSIARPAPGKGVASTCTPEMRAMAEALAHPDGDPYLNARKMGFYCEQCG